MVAIDQSQNDDWPPSISSKNPKKKKKILKLLNYLYWHLEDIKIKNNSLTYGRTIGFTYVNLNMM